MSDETLDLPGLLDPLGEHTEVTYGLCALIGAALLNNIGSVETMGWSSPKSSLDYTEDAGDVHTRIVRDFIVWSSGRKSFSPDAEERLRNFVKSTGWQKHQMASLADLLMPFAGPSEEQAS